MIESKQPTVYGTPNLRGMDEVALMALFIKRRNRVINRGSFEVISPHPHQEIENFLLLLEIIQFTGNRFPYGLYLKLGEETPDSEKPRRLEIGLRRIPEDERKRVKESFEGGFLFITSLVDMKKGEGPDFFVNLLSGREKGGGGKKKAILFMGTGDHRLFAGKPSQEVIENDNLLSPEELKIIEEVTEKANQMMLFYKTDERKDRFIFSREGRFNEKRFFLIARHFWDAIGELKYLSNSEDEDRSRESSALEELNRIVGNRFSQKLGYYDGENPMSKYMDDKNLFLFALNIDNRELLFNQYWTKLIENNPSIVSIAEKLISLLKGKKDG